MIAMMIKYIIESLLEKLRKQAVKDAIDSALDKIEDAVKKTKNPFDDMIILPFIQKVIREPFNIPDNDEPK